MKLAILLFGRVGTFQRRTIQMKFSDSGDPVIVKLCAQSLISQIVSQRKERVDFFVQSFNPELTDHMRKIYAPVAYLHQPQNSTFHCRNPKGCVLHTLKVGDIRIVYGAKVT
jgi:hypothetical protein